MNVAALCPGPTTSGFQTRAAMEESRPVRGRELMNVDTVAQAGYAGLVRGRQVVDTAQARPLLHKQGGTDVRDDRPTGRSDLAGSFGTNCLWSGAVLHPYTQQKCGLAPLIVIAVRPETMPSWGHGLGE